MTPARAHTIRAERIEGKRQSKKEIRDAEEARRRAEQEAEEAIRKAEEDCWPISRLREAYKAQNPHVKAIDRDEDRFNCYPRAPLGDREPKELVPLDVDRVRIKLLKTLKPATVCNALELLRHIINYGGCIGFQVKFPARFVANDNTPPFCQFSPSTGSGTLPQRLACGLGEGYPRTVLGRVAGLGTG